MQITRRTFLNSLTALAAVTVASGHLTSTFGQKKVKGELFQIPAEVYSDPLFRMGAKQFEAFVGQTFVLTSESGVTFEVVLREVNPKERFENSNRGYTGECFSLIFEGGEFPSPLLQGTYDVANLQVGTFAALVVPTGRRQLQYEIVVNRLGA